MTFPSDYLQKIKQRTDALQWPDWVLNPSLIAIPDKINNALPRIKDIQIEPKIKISVIIPNYQKQIYFSSIFKQMAIQKFPPDMFEVIVIDDNSPNSVDNHDVYMIMENIRVKYDDWNISFYQTHKNVTYNIAKAYNIGVKRAKHDVIFNNDADAWQFGKYLENASKYHTYFKEKNMKASVHPCMITHTPTERETLRFDIRSKHDTGPVIHKRDLIACQGFDETIIGWGGSEQEFVSRLKKVGVNHRWSPDLLIGTSIGGFTWKLIWPPFDSSHIPLPDQSRWGSTRDLSKCNPNTDPWGEIDTLERIF